MSTGRSSWTPCAAALAVLCWTLSLPLGAQPRARSAGDFGIQDSTPYWISGAEFHSVSPAEFINYQPPSCLFHGSAVLRDFDAELHLPHGARLISMRIYWYDTDPDADLTVSLRRVDWSLADSPVVTEVAFAGSQGSATRGSDFVNLNHTVDNFPAGTLGEGERSYFLKAILPPSQDHYVALCAVRILWRRQLSPAPLVATYDDVPTNHPDFRYIESLAAAGITSGCGSQNFCPDNPVTRGQLAVFMARALGLHWPAP